MNDPVTQYAFLTSLGMNNRFNELDFNGEYVLLAQNARFQQMPNSVLKREPLAYYNETTMLTTEGICGLTRYYSVFGPLLVAVCGSTVYVGNDATGTMTAILTLTTTNIRMMFTVYNNLLLMSNGIDPILVYDGGTAGVCWQLGSCQAVGTSSGGSISATSISYAITADSDAYVNGAISNTISTLTSGMVVLNYIPLGPVGTTNRKIYRKDSGTSGNYKLVHTLADNSTTTYTDTTASGSLGASMPSTTDPMPVGSWILIYAERLFITGDPNNPNRIYYSEPYLPNYIQVDTNTDYIDVAKNDGDQIQGLVVQNGVMICIKQNNMRKMKIDAAESNADPATWSAEDPFCQLGTPARYSITQTPFGVVFLSWDAWYIYDGGSLPQPIILQFDPTQILPANYGNVVTTYNNGMLYASYTSISSGLQYPSQVMVYDMKLKQMSVDTYSAGAFASATGVNESGELYIGNATMGFVYRAEEGDVFSSITSLTQAQSGTGNNIFIGGTQNDAFIQIGVANNPQSIPNGICLFWDDTTTTPGGGWTEITAYQGYYPVVSTTSGTTGGSSSHTHSITGTTSTNIGPNENSGNGNNQAEGQSHNHSVSGTSDQMFANPNYFGLRVFYKNNSTTEYQFPVGSILMWDQSNSPDGWIPYGQSQGGYLRLMSPVASAPNWTVGTAYTVGQYVTATNPFTSQSQIYYCQIAHTSGVYDNTYNNIYGSNYGIYYTPSTITVTFADDLAAGFWTAQYSNLGVMVTDTHAHPYGCVSSFQTGASPSPSNVSDSPDANLDGTKNAHTHYMIGVTNGVNTGSGTNWDLDRVEITFIKKLVTGETPYDGTSKNVVALFWDTGAPASPSNGWSEIGATCQAYNSTASYVAGSQVTFSGTYYECIQAGMGFEPDISPLYWTAVSTPTVYIKSEQNALATFANNGYTHNHGNTPAILTSPGIQAWCNGGSAAQTGQQHQHTVFCATSTVAIPNPTYVSFRLWSKLLGQMVPWNNAVTTTYTNGLYYSPVLQLNVQTFGELFYNAQKAPADTIAFYFNTSATSAELTNGLLNGTSLTWSGSTFTYNSHGLVNGNVITIQATTFPTGLAGNVIYYVINAATNTFQVSLTSGGSAVTFSGGSNPSYAVAIFYWYDKITSSDTIIAATPNTWVAYVVQFVAADTTVSNPTLVTANEFIIQFSYSRVGEIAESAVEFIYTTGRLNAGNPYVDKIYKRIASAHTGTAGQVQVTWTTENASNSFFFDLSAFPSKWASFFQDAAMGETVEITYYKNDLYDFNLRQFTLQYTPQPMLL